MSATVEERHAAVLADRQVMERAADDWRACLRRLAAGAAWFAGHDEGDPDWPRAVELRRGLHARLLRARVQAGNALLAYSSRCAALDADPLDGEWARYGVDPRDKRALWLAVMPNVYETLALAEPPLIQVWWESRVGPPPERRAEADALLEGLRRQQQEGRS